MFFFAALEGYCGLAFLAGERWAPSRCSGPTECPLWVVHSLTRDRRECLTISHSRFPHLGGDEDGRESTLSCSSVLTITISESPRNRPALLSPSVSKIHLDRYYFHVDGYGDVPFGHQGFSLP